MPKGSTEGKKYVFGDVVATGTLSTYLTVDKWLARIW